MLETTKAEDAQTIGKFGMGFKSVFKYTCEPQIFSDDEAFRIKNYLLPEEIETDWNYVEQMTTGISYSLNGGEEFVPFLKSKHLTKVILPFQKREKTGEIHRIDGSDIVLKLKDLEPEILLFLSTIQNFKSKSSCSANFSISSLAFIFPPQFCISTIVCRIANTHFHSA